MADKFYVPKFITIEDRLAGFFTLRQVFALFFAFLISYFFAKINTLLGIVVGIILFSIAIMGTFWYVNGKPFINIIFTVIKKLIFGERYVWKKIEKLSYKEIEVSEIGESKEAYPPFIEPRKKHIFEAKEIITEIKAPEIAPSFKENLVISLEKPLSQQAEIFKPLSHQHKLNPENPYRLFPYIKFYQRKHS